MKTPNEPRHLSFTAKSEKTENKLTSKITINDPVKSRYIGEKNNFKGEFIALWDTGVTSSVISEQVAQQMNLKPTGQTEVSTAGGIFIFKIRIL